MGNWLYKTHIANATEATIYAKVTETEQVAEHDITITWELHGNVGLDAEESVEKVAKEKLDEKNGVAADEKETEHLKYLPVLPGFTLIEPGSYLAFYTNGHAMVSVYKRVKVQDGEEGKPPKFEFSMVMNKKKHKRHHSLIITPKGPRSARYKTGIRWTDTDGYCWNPNKEEPFSKVK